MWVRHGWLTAAVGLAALGFGVARWASAGPVVERGIPGAAADGGVWRVPENDGMNSLFLLFKICQRPVEYRDLKRDIDRREGRVSLTDLRDVARRHGLAAGVYRTTPSGLAAMGMPALVHFEDAVGQGSFWLVYQVNEKNVECVAGSAMALKTIPMEEFRRVWSGYALAPRYPYERWTLWGVASLAVFGGYSWWRVRPALRRARVGSGASPVRVHSPQRFSSV
jgi:hypothetical protein